VILIIDARLEETKKQLSRINLHLQVEESAKWYLAVHGWSPSSGVRPLERIIRSELLSPLATCLLEDRVSDEWTVVLSRDVWDKLSIDFVEPVPQDEVKMSWTDETSPSAPPLMDDLHGEVGAETSPGGSISGAEREGNRNITFIPSSGPPALQLLPQRL